MYASTSNTVPAVLSTAVYPVISPTITVALNDSVSITNIFNWLNVNAGGGPSTLRLVMVPTLTILINATFGVNYTWNTNLKFNFKADMPGTTQYKLYGTDGMGDILFFYVTTMIPTGVADMKHNPSAKLSVFPNPASDEVTVAFNASKEKTNIEVFDIQGRLVYIDTDDREIGENKIKLNTSNFSAGIYIVRAGTETFKITKI